MLFDRQRLLMALLDALGGPVGHTDFQKLLFLYTKECEPDPSYDFVPYRFGAFSFTSYADKRKLINEKYLENDDNNWLLTDAGREEAKRKAGKFPLADDFCRRYSGIRGSRLIIEQYSRYPYYASRSEIIDKLGLGAEAMARIESAGLKPQAAGLATIGYEGYSLERYLNELLRAGVTVLCDVRRNPLSRKYGFSKGVLGRSCESVGVKYEHLPELGIASEKRRDLVTQADYDELFEYYEKHNLPQQDAAISKIYDWIEAGGKVALACYEAEPEKCHRHCVSETLERRSGSRLITQHL